MVLERIKGNWASCIEQLGDQNPASASKILKDRIQRGPQDQEHIRKGAWAGESSNVIGQAIILARATVSPLVRYAEKATQAHREGKEFYLTSEILDPTGKPYSQSLVEIADADSKKIIGQRRAINLGNISTHQVPTDSFADDKGISFLAGGNAPAEKYGNWLKKEFGYKEVTVYFPNISDSDFTRAVWLYSLGSCGRSVFGCVNRDLDLDYDSVFRV